MDRSELAALWKDSAEHSAWVAVQRDSIERLGRPAAKRSKPPRTKATPEPRPTAVLYLEVPENGFSAGSYHPFRTTGLPRLPDPDRRPRAPLAGLPRVDIELGMDFTEDELDRISSWLAEAPHVTVGLSDLSRARGYRHEPARLARFDRARTLKLFLQKAPDVRFLETFRELQSLIVVRSKCSLDLPALPSLRRLVVHTAPLPDLRTWAHLARLEELRLPLHPAPEHLDVLPSLRFLEVALGDLASLARLPLEGLELSDVAEETDLAALARSTTLQFLSLHLHTPAQTAQIAQLPRLSNLRLWIADDASPELVEGLRGHATLERVMVSGFGWQRIMVALQAMGFTEGEPGDWPTD